MKKQKFIILILTVLLTLESALLVYLLIRRPKKIPPAPPAVAPKGRIAIVLDDWGYNIRNLGALDDIKYPLTFSVLPNLRYSFLVSRQLHRRGFEVILHLPMEPRERYRLEKDTILTTMEEAQIKKIIEADLKSIASARGVSNHMGSRATEDLPIMRTIFNELKKRHLYFLDSCVSVNSLSSQLAGEMGIGLAVRDVFLDNRQDPAYIKAQINQLKNLARSRGYAVGIGHDRKNTVEVLKEMMPQLVREGFRFVFISEIVR